jgi:hypothetical protein
MLFGIGSIILNSYGYEFQILMWLGEGNTSRIIIAVVGLLLMIFGASRNNNQEDTKE